MNRHRTTLVIVSVLLAGLCGCATFARPTPEPFTLVVLPDTQCYADIRTQYAAKHWGNGDLRELFFQQTSWIKENRDALNIAMVAHLGDVVQADHDHEWWIADRAFGALDHEVPYILALGNHDMGWGDLDAYSGTARDTNLNQFFPPARFQSNPLYRYGGNLDGVSDNYYLLFSAGGMKFLILSLEFKPRDEALAWANEVVARYPERRCIVVTHAFVDAKRQLNDMKHYKVEGNGAQAVWDKFVKRHASIFLVLCGHYTGEATITLKGDHGNDVHALLADYQGWNNGGDGYLRIMTFIPAVDTIDVRTYSPVLDNEIFAPESRFTLPYPMKGDTLSRAAAG
ncbi:MAG: metallophosphoesterase [Candidatus Hydrogenedentes bacterium]|nr:metallophosphoesterase [Candidatus Hydrogenedentota bacterium]